MHALKRPAAVEHEPKIGLTTRPGSLCMKSLDVLRCLYDDGWIEVKQRGSHVQLKHPSKPGRVTVPHPKRDLPMGTLKSIEKQSGVKLT